MGNRGSIGLEVVTPDRNSFRAKDVTALMGQRGPGAARHLTAGGNAIDMLFGLEQRRNALT